MFSNANIFDVIIPVVAIIALVAARIYRLRCEHEQIMYGFRKPKNEDED